MESKESKTEYHLSYDIIERARPYSAVTILSVAQERKKQYKVGTAIEQTSVIPEESGGHAIYTLYCSIEDK